MNNSFKRDEFNDTVSSSPHATRCQRDDVATSLRCITGARVHTKCAPVCAVEWRCKSHTRCSVSRATLSTWSQNKTPSMDTDMALPSKQSSYLMMNINELKKRFEWMVVYTKHWPSTATTMRPSRHDTCACSSVVGGCERSVRGSNVIVWVNNYQNNK